MPAKDKPKICVSLLPGSLNGDVISRNLAFKMGADGGNIQLQSRAGLGNLRGFDAVDTLVKAVE